MRDVGRRIAEEYVKLREKRDQFLTQLAADYDKEGKQEQATIVLNIKKSERRRRRFRKLSSITKPSTSKRDTYFEIPHFDHDGDPWVLLK